MAVFKHLLCVRHSLRAWGLWRFVCLFQQMRTVSLQRCSELLPNPQDQDNLTIVRSEFWLVSESGLVISVASRESASRISRRQGLPPGPLPRVDCTPRSSSPAFSVDKGLRSPNLCAPIPKLLLTQLERQGKPVSGLHTQKPLSGVPVEAQKLPPTHLEMALGLLT